MRFILALFFLSAIGYSADSHRDACEKVRQPDFKAEAGDETPYLCELPHRVKENIPEVYWWADEKYQKWLAELPAKGQAPANFGKSHLDSHEKVNRLVLSPKACHFYSSISPSVQKKVVAQDSRTRIVLDHHDLLAQCRVLARKIKNRKIPPCSTIELAGHSTQSIGLDTVFGIDEVKGNQVFIPSAKTIDEIGSCFRAIAAKGAHVVFSTCGGDKDVAGGKRFWPGKLRAQSRLREMIQLPIISGVGIVEGTKEGGVACDDGWHVTAE